MQPKYLESRTVIIPIPCTRPLRTKSRPIILTTQETEIRKIRVQSSPDKKQARLSQKHLGEWLKWYSACLTSMKPQIQNLRIFLE
jgi:hypothetical protein